MMGTKETPGTYDCYAAALPDEPLFVLLARDPSAPRLLREWAKWRETAIKHGDRPPTDTPMVRSARVCADQMEEWRRTNDGKWRPRSDQ
jgi:hypothetical protein